MKKMILSLLAVLCCGTMFASNHPGPGQFGVTAEYLYLMPSIDDTYFVVKSPLSQPPINGGAVLIGERYNNDFDFSSGFRVAGLYSFCSCLRGVELAYTHFNQSHNQVVTGSFLNATVGGANFLTLLSNNPLSFSNYPGTATSNLSVEYNRGEGIFCQSVFDCCHTNICLLMGFECYDLHINEHYRFQNTAISLLGVNKQTSHVWGAGPELGVEINYAFWNLDSYLPGTLSLIVKSTATVLITEITTKIYSATTDSTAVTTIYSNANDEKSWKTLPAFHARVGLGYETCLYNYETSLEIGYEFNSYLRAFARGTTTNDVATLVVTEYNNFDLQGLYVSASVNF